MVQDRGWTPQTLALLEQAREGRRAAAYALFELHWEAVLRVVRRHLGWPLRRLVDSTDIIQDVGAEFCASTIPADVFASPERFMAYLVGMAKHKLHEAERRYLEAGRRTLRRDVPLERAGATNLPSGSREPHEILIQEELWVAAEQALPSIHRAIVRLWRSGNTQREMAACLGISERTVRRLLQRLINQYSCAAKNG